MKNGQKKLWDGGTSMSSSQMFVLTDYDNRTIFGDDNNAQDDTTAEDDQLSVACLTRQCALRRQAAATQSRSNDVQQSQPPDLQSGSNDVQQSQAPNLQSGSNVQQSQAW